GRIRPLLPRSPFLYAILDSQFSTDLVGDGRQALRAGAGIFQIRAKTLTPRKLYDIVAALAPDCAAANVPLIVNDNVDVALLTGAAGVHLGQEDCPAGDARNILPHQLIGISTHNETQAAKASQCPVDYISVGPVFPTRSKANPDPVVGLDFVRKICATSKLPVVCIGGITAQAFSALISAGAGGLAVISAIYEGPSVYDTISRLLEALQHRKSD